LVQQGVLRATGNRIDVMALSKGIYTIQISNKNSSVSTKFIVE
jgi:hypothetical protein